MNEPYSEAVATHYAAYRPPLHRTILTRVLAGTGGFSDALDVGCGTGWSSLALAEFCDRVFAIDPSQSMLDGAPPHDSVAYLLGAAERIPLPDDSIDLVTFAGSLSYADREATAVELRRVCRPDAMIVPCADRRPVATFRHRYARSGLQL